MADVDFDELGAMPYEPSVPRRNTRSQRLLNIAGAASSIALVIGVGFWGYKIAVRDVSGVPVLRALEGPMRVAPENPGGEVALHQGLSVNNVAEAGVASPPPDRLLLAPRTEELSLEDTPGLAGPVAVAAKPEPAANEAGADLMALADSIAGSAPALSGTAESAERVVTPPPAPLIAAPAPLVEDTETSVADTTAGDPLAEVGALPVPEPVEQVAELPPAPEDELNAEDPVLAAPAEAVPVAVARSLVPMPRPARPGAVEGVQEVSASATDAAPAKEVSPESIKIGERLVQLGAFDDEAGARAEWDKLSIRFGDLMAGKAMVVQSAQSGGRAFFRLRAQGFEGEDDARRFCAALLAEETACIPVANR